MILLSLTDRPTGGFSMSLFLYSLCHCVCILFTFYLFSFFIFCILFLIVFLIVWFLCFLPSLHMCVIFLAFHVTNPLSFTSCFIISFYVFDFIIWVSYLLSQCYNICFIASLSKSLFFMLFFLLSFSPSLLNFLFLSFLLSVFLPLLSPFSRQIFSYQSFIFSLLFSLSKR